MRVILAGLDLSLRCSAIAICRTDWDGQWSTVETMTCGEELQEKATDNERAKRIARIAERLLTRIRWAANGAAVECWIESYAMGLRSASSSGLMELGGVVRHELRGWGHELRTANMSSARKLLLGKVPTGKGLAKKTCQATLRSAGMPRSWGLDESDAMVCLNYGLSEHAGATCFMAGQVGIGGG